MPQFLMNGTLILMDNCSIAPELTINISKTDLFAQIAIDLWAVVAPFVIIFYRLALPFVIHLFVFLCVFFFTVLCFTQMSFWYCLDHFAWRFSVWGFVVSFNVPNFFMISAQHRYCVALWIDHRKAFILSTFINHRLNWSIMA